MEEHKKRYCPLFTIGASELGNSDPQKCMEDKCAWWDKYRRECCLLVLSLINKES